MNLWSWIPIICYYGFFACEAQNIPVFTTNPQGGVYLQGATLSLSCTATGSLSIQWIQNDLILTSSQVFISGGTLGIFGLTPAQTGSYRCIAVGSGGVNVTSSVALVQIADVQGAFFYSTNSNSPTSVTVTSGQPIAILGCGNFTSTTSSITYQWKLAPNSIIPDGHQAVSLPNGSLFLQNPNSNNNERTYQCITSGSPIVTQSVYVLITVTTQGTTPSASPILIVQPQSLVVNQGDAATFLCVSGGGSPSPMVSWSYPNPSNSQVNSYLSSSHVDIVVSNANAANQGTYTCTSGGTSYSSVLTVRNHPILDAANSLSLAAPRSFLYGSAFTLYCNASGDQLTWLWYHNGRRLGSSNNTLVVPSPTLADAGIYQCFAYGLFSAVSAIGNVTIRTLPATFAGGVVLSSAIAFIGQPFQFTCKARGAPSPTYQWYKDGVILSGSTAYSVDNVGGSLTINYVDASYTGMYLCVAANQIPGQTGVLGSDMSSANLTTIAPTVITQSPPANLSIQVGDSATLPCQATTSATNTLLLYNWTKDGSPLSVAGRLSYISGTGSISISPVQMSDAGLYQCTVNTLLINSLVSAIALTTSISQVTITATPVMAAITAVTALNSTAIQVSWLYSGVVARLNAYLVQVRVFGSGVWTNGSTVSPNVITTVTVGSLLPFTLYEVQVVLLLNGGISVGSKVSAVMTLQAPPGEAPSSVVTTPIGATEIELTWVPPSKAGSNGVLTDYCVQYRVTGSNVPFYEVYVGSNSTMYLLTGLQPLYSYEIRVAANTSAGRGPFSSVVISSAYNYSNLPFSKTVGFIAMLVAIGLVIAAVFMLTCILIVWRQHHKTKIYRVRSGTFMSTEDVHLERDIIQDYEMRGKKFQQNSQQQNGSEIDGTSYTESVHTAQMGGGSATYMLQAPEYINPPSFEEFTKRSRAYSRDRLNEDFQEATSKEELHHTIPHSNSKQQFDQDSEEEVSIDKPSLSSTPPSDSQGDTTYGKMAQAIVTGTFV